MEKGKLKTGTGSVIFFEKIFPLSGSFEASAGYYGDYPFEIIIPLYYSKHHGSIHRMITAVANVKGRPDVVSDEMFPFYDTRIAQKKAL